MRLDCSRSVRSVCARQPHIFRSRLAGSRSVLLGRLACLFAVAVLFCVSSAHSQVIEEGGFPVKGGGVSGESFSLSCPPRLVVEAGESVALSCSATDVPEEGVRYGWESLSGEGFYLLSASDELSPLFTAPLSGAGEEYAYRLTAMAAGVYRTASVAVSVGGVSGETVGAPIVREECDPFTVPEGLGEGCAEDKGPAPFGFGSEAEGGFLFPEAPGLPDRPSGPVRGGGSVMQAPPRLECPVAIFLEELETGSIECRVFDASGEEHLEYSWEPAGNTTRDYLENPRLIPEDSPTPSVVAPEAPAYETLESFRSVETTFRYRYRLTATSRATGLSSSSEVEVFVSGSRPGVYCPLEVAAQEGETVALDCEGADPLSSRMDYDEEEASILWEWEGLWGASTALLDATDRSSPLFTAPLGSAGEQYHYIASMTSSSSSSGLPRTARRRVTVRVVGEEEGTQASSDASALSRKGGAPVVACEDSKVYEATADFTLDCSVENEPAGAEYRWTGTDVSNRLSGTDSLTPAFAVPGDINEPGEANKDYDYTVTMTVAGSDTASAVVVVTVLEKPDIYCTEIPGLTGTGSIIIITEGLNSFQRDHCEGPWGGAPDSRYMFRWTSPGLWGGDLSLLSATDIERPVIYVPDMVPEDDPYLRYYLTVSAENADPRRIHVAFRLDFPKLSVSCEKTYYEVYEGSEDFPFSCSASGAFSGFAYEYEWTARGYTADMSLLSAADVASPVFYVPDELAYNTTYSYRLKVSAARARSKTVDVRVKVLDNPNIVVACPDSPYEVYEGSEDFDLECSASGAPEGSAYDYAWTAVRSRTNMALLSAADVASPTFRVPDEVAALGERHEYLLVASAQGADSGQKRVRVTVLDRALAVDCRRRSYEVHEGSEDIAFDCSASGDHSGTGYEYEWTSLGDTPDTSLLSAAGIASPAFLVPDAVEDDEQYAYRLTVRANAEDASVDVSVRVLNLNREALAVVCADPGAVYEGSADVAFDCTASGAAAGSSYAYSWRAGGATSGASLLSRTDIASPVFYVPDEVDEDETYEYLLTVSAANAEDASVDVSVRVLNLNREALAVVCADPGSVYEGSSDITLACSASGAPAGSSYVYSWRAQGATANTDLLSSTDGPTPTFLVPDEVDSDEIYEYRLTVSADNAGSATAEVTVTVLNKGALALACADPGSVYEGSADVAFDCEASGAPSGSSYTYSWRARGGTSNTDLLSATDGPAPTFEVPDALDETTTYEYLLTVSAANAEDAAAEVTITVLNKEALALACADPGSVYEGSADFSFDCSASGAPEGSDYEYAWTALGGTADTDLLSATDGPAPTFEVPDALDETTTYEYLLTVSAENAEDAAAEVTVTVLNSEALALACANPGSVYEGTPDITLDCSASGAPEGSDYAYVWTGRGGTSNTDLLSATDGPAPTFHVPEEVEDDETYEYLLTVSAANAEDAAAEVTITVLNKEALALACADPGSVYEGSADFSFDCSASGAPEGSDYEYAWTALGGTADTDLLSATDGPAPTFEVPDALDETTTYEYLLTVSAENAEDAAAEVTVTVLNSEALALACANPGSVYEGTPDITLDCSASGAPEGSDYAYVWTGRGGTSNTDLLSATDGPAPTFHVPEEVEDDETYEYLLTVSAANAEDAAAEVTITVLNKEALALACADPGSVYEGSADFSFDCSASGAPEGSDYEYAWTALGGTSNTDLLSATDGPAPTFEVPDALDETTTYEYLLTVSAENAEDAAAEVTVTVLNREALALACANPGSVYEGTPDITLDCSASGAPEGSDYAYAWTARGGTADTDLLSATDGSTPTFLVPDEVDNDEIYEYRLTVSAGNAGFATAEVTVTVLNSEALALACANPGAVYEGSADVAFDCTASGAPGGSSYEYAWTARGGTADTDLLSATDGPAPTFLVPDEVDSDETYEYLLTVSAGNAEDAAAEVTVTVLNSEALALACANPGAVYEGSADVAFDCTASGAPGGSSYEYAWTARGGTADTDLLSATDGPAPTFLVPDEVDSDETYEYLLTVSAGNAEDAAAEVTVTVLNSEALALACANPGAVYEGSADVAFDCTASGAPGGSSYEYAWTARGGTADTDLLSATDGPAPTFLVPDEVDSDETYEYLLTVSAGNAEDAAAEVTVTVLNSEALALACANPGSVYEGTPDITLDCSASGAPEGSDYAYAWTARGGTADTDLLSATDGPAPTFEVPDALDETTTYEYLLTVSAENAEDAAAEVTVTVLNKEALALACADPGSVYEGSADFSFDCSASGAPEGSDYEYAWTARGGTADMSLLSAADNPSPTFYVPDAVDVTTDYEYLLTVSAENAEDASAEITVTVLNREALGVACVDPGSVYEGSEDITLDCSASGAPEGSDYEYAWTARGGTADTDLLSAMDIASPTFYVPDEVSEDETYEYLLTVSAANAEDASAEAAVTVLDRVLPPVADSSPRATESSAPGLSEASSLGVTASASPLRFGVQSADTQVSLDPMTDGISTRVSGPYHAGRMTLSPGSSEEVDENGPMDLSIELASPVVLRRKGGVEAASIVLEPIWSFAESCEQLSSQAIGGLYTETTLADGDCRLLHFGGELDLTDVLPGEYAGSLDVVLRSGENEETHSVEVEVTVVPAQRVITIGPGGVRFSTSRELPAGLTEEQNLSIYPDVAFMTREKPHGAFELSNPSLIPLEVTVSARFGYTEATENGREVVVEDTSESHLGDLSEVVDIYPNVLVLMPGEKGLVRYGVQEGALAAMPEKGYAAFFDVASEPRQYVRSDRMPEEVSGDRTARVTMRVPGMYVPGEGASQLRATLVSISFVGSPSATFLVETEDRPFAGEVVAYDGEGRELGRRETLVYTRSRVRIPLDRIPEEDAVFLRFAPRGSGRVPAPAVVEWDAPRRDIGAAQDKKQTPGSAAIAGKP